MCIVDAEAGFFPFKIKNKNHNNNHGLLDFIFSMKETKYIISMLLF
jgi:hypothetical protein